MDLVKSSAAENLGSGFLHCFSPGTVSLGSCILSPDSWVYPMLLGSWGCFSQQSTSSCSKFANNSTDFLLSPVYGTFFLLPLILLHSECMCPSKIRRLKLNPQCDDVKRWGRSSGAVEVMWVEPSCLGLVPYKRNLSKPVCPFYPLCQMRVQKEPSTRNRP